MATNSDRRPPRRLPGIEHGAAESFDKHGFRCGRCVAAWTARGPEIEKIVAAAGGGDA